MRFGISSMKNLEQWILELRRDDDTFESAPNESKFSRVNRRGHS